MLLQCVTHQIVNPVTAQTTQEHGGLFIVTTPWHRAFEKQFRIEQERTVR